jgi:hypothetical protein
VLPSGQKLTLGLLATIALELVSFHEYAPFLGSSIFKRILEVVFCEGFQHYLRFCINHLDNVKMAALQFYTQSGKQRTVGWVVDDSHVLW